MENAGSTLALPILQKGLQLDPIFGYSLNSHPLQGQVEDGLV
jgi:hypothetical protein